MGGRGASSVQRYRSGDVNLADIVETESLISQREHKKEEVDSTLSVLKDVYDEYGLVLDDVQTAKLKGNGNNFYAYYDGSNVAVNERYFDIQKLNKSYDNGVRTGFHPPRGNKDALQATVAHEMEHALNEHAANLMGLNGFSALDRAADVIVHEARKLCGHKGVVQMASRISTYATKSNVEAVAEAYCDVYCNGAKARTESKAIVKVLNRKIKGD